LRIKRTKRNEGNFLFEFRSFSEESKESKIEDQSFKNSIQKLLSDDSFQEPLFLKNNEEPEQRNEQINLSRTFNDESKKRLNKGRPYSEFEFDFEENEDPVIREESPWTSSEPFTPFRSVKLHQNQSPLTNPPKNGNSGKMSSFKDLMKKVGF
jgi:hypothetical protein